MKTRIALLLGIFFTVNLFAQGRVGFANTSTTLITTNSFGGGSGPTTGINQYLFGLYIAPQGTSDPNAFSLVGTATNGTVPVNNGRFNGGNPFVIPGNNGETIAFQVRGWAFSAGATYEQAIVNTFLLGSSAIGQVTPATGVALTPALFGTGAGQVGGFVIGIVPEPSSTVFLLLGAAGFGLWRFRFRRC